MLWDGFCFLADVSSWYELFVCCDDYIGDRVGFLVYIVGGDVVAKFCADPVSIVSPVCFVKVDEGSLFMGFFVFVNNEGGGKYREMVGGKLSFCSPGGVGGKVRGDYCEVR